jgi:hypothetical protein
MEGSWDTLEDLSGSRVALEKTERKGEGVGSKVEEQDKFQLEMASLNNIW